MSSDRLEGHNFIYLALPVSASYEPKFHECLRPSPEISWKSKASKSGMANPLHDNLDIFPRLQIDTRGVALAREQQHLNLTAELRFPGRLTPEAPDPRLSLASEAT